VTLVSPVDAGSGAYRFTGIATGTYTLTQLTQPAGYLDGREGVGTFGGITGTGDIIAGIAVTQLLDFDAGYVFGELLPASAQAIAWFDVNGDGQRQSDEPLIESVQFVLSGTTDIGSQVRLTQTTGVNGDTTFGNLRPGSYLLLGAQPAGYVDGAERACSYTSSASSALAGNDAIALTFYPGGTASSCLFGEGISGVSGFVFIDANNNAIRESESGLNGVALQLTGVQTDSVLVTRTATTNAYGFYFISGLTGGSYIINETQPGAYLDGREQLGALGGSVVGADAIQFSMLEGQNAGGYNFGELQSASLSARVFFDVDNDGVADFGELPIAGVTVTLSGTTDIGSQIALTGVTSGAGTFTFSGLRPGTYVLFESQPVGYTDGKDTPGGAGGASDGIDTISDINLQPGQNPAEYLFGERQTGLSGYIYRDGNNNGQRELVNPGSSTPWSS
jgi:hypothetical protein